MADQPVHQGDVFWIDVGEPVGSEPADRRPFVVIQNDLLNQSRLRTVVMCALTSNLQRGRIPGNVALAAAEGNLPLASVVNVTQIYTVDKSQLTEYVGTLAPGRVRQIVAGISHVVEPRSLP